MFYDNLKTACDNLNLKITPIVAECGGSKGSISNWKNGVSPNSDIVAKLSVRLNVSSDFLIFGEEKKVILSDDEKELISYYNKLTEVEKIKLVSRAETLAEQYTDISQKEIRLNDQTDDDEEIIINVAARGLGVTSVTTTKKALERLASLEPEDDLDL